MKKELLISVFCLGLVACSDVSEKSTAEKLHIQMIVDELNLPPEPNETEDNSTVEGVDANANGIRDKIERFNAFMFYPDKTKIAIVNEEARLERAALSAIDDMDELEDLTIQFSAISLCTSRVLSDEEALDYELNAPFKDTAERLQRYADIRKVYSPDPAKLPSLSEYQSLCEQFLNTLK